MICNCGNHIEKERLELGLKICKSCAFTGKDVGKVRGTMVYTHKTAPSIQIMKKEVFEKTRSYYVPRGARSAVKNFSKNLCS